MPILTMSKYKQNPFLKNIFSDEFLKLDKKLFPVVWPVDSNSVLNVPGQRLQMYQQKEKTFWHVYFGGM